MRSVLLKTFDTNSESRIHLFVCIVVVRSKNHFIFILNKRWRKGSSKIHNLKWFFSCNVSHPPWMFFHLTATLRILTRMCLIWLRLSIGCVEITIEDSINTPALDALLTFSINVSRDVGYVAGLWCGSEMMRLLTPLTQSDGSDQWWWSVNHFVCPLLSSSHMQCSELN